MVNASTQTVLRNRAGQLVAPGERSLDLTNPGLCQKRLVICVSGEISKPTPTDTANFAGDGTLNAVRSLMLTVDRTIVVQAAPRDLFWVSALLQAGTSEFREADINNTSSAGPFPFSWCLEINLDLPGEYFSNLAGVFGAQSVQLDLQWGTLDEILIKPPPGWTLNNVRAEVLVVETGWPDAAAPLLVSCVSNVFPLFAPGIQQPFPNADGPGDLLGFAYLVRASDLMAIPPPRRDERDDGILGELSVRSARYTTLFSGTFKLLQQMNLARRGPRVGGPVVLGPVRGVAYLDFTRDGFNGALSVNHATVIQTVPTVEQLPAGGATLTILTYKTTKPSGAA